MGRFRKDVNLKVTNTLFIKEYKLLQSGTEYSRILGWKGRLADISDLFQKIDDNSFYLNYLALRLELLGFAYNQYLISAGVNRNLTIDYGLKASEIVNDFPELKVIAEAATDYNKAIGMSTGGNAMEYLAVVFLMNTTKNFLTDEELEQYPKYREIIVGLNQVFWKKFDKLFLDFKAYKLVN